MLCSIQERVWQSPVRAPSAAVYAPAYFFQLLQCIFYQPASEAAVRYRRVNLKRFFPERIRSAPVPLSPDAFYNMRDRHTV